MTNSDDWGQITHTLTSDRDGRLETLLRALLAVNSTFFNHHLSNGV